MTLVIIEEHDKQGVTWGLSTAGSNPPPEEFVEVGSREEAVRIKTAYEQGDIRPFLTAAQAVVADASWQKRRDPQ